MFRKLAATVAVSTALMTSQAWSLGLGELKTESGLNQPLNAEIVLLSSKDLQESDLRARVASFEAYERYGVTREPFHSQLRFEVYTKADGSKAVRVSSNSPIKEPYVNIIIELDWPQGKLMREYTLLLDPPVFNKTTPVLSQPEPSQTQVTPSQRPSAVAEEVKRTPAETRPTQKEPELEPESQQTRIEEPKKQPAPTTTERRSAPAFEGNSWSVGRGQTLWSIAKELRPENATVQQTLIALYRANPDAFINSDINRVKAGSTLKVPDQSFVDSISHAEALSEYRASLSKNQAPLDVRKTVSETQTTSEPTTKGGRLSIASVEDSSLNQAGGSETESNSVDELQGEVNTLREAVETLKLQNQQLKEELQAKEDLADTGVQLEDDTLAVLSGSAEAAEDSLPIEPVTEPDVIEEQSSDDISSTQPEQAETEKTAAAKPTTLPSTQPETKEEPFYQAENFWYWVGGGLLGLLVLAGGAVYWRNRQPPAEGESSLIPTFGDSGRKKEPTSPRDSFLDKTKVSGEELPSDPISEADILIARGKMTQANHLLEKALTKDPKNDEVRVKLMEILASQKNAESFYEVKKGLTKDFDYDSKLGLKVASLSSLVEPPKAAKPIAKSSTALPDEDDVFGFDDLKEGKEVNVDLSAELEATEEPEVETTSTSDSLDFDLSDFEKEVEATANQEKSRVKSEAQPEVQKDSNIDFSLESDDEDLVTEEQGADSSLQMADDDASGVSEDEVQTKLELAKAYLEMGDEDSAKDILQEVQKEGNSTQSEEAAKLLAKR
ncbi:MAG: pilus assembly protein FimV [Kangiella sp.]|nr:pilus assembly protein FimV [Kangiella sp.]